MRLGALSAFVALALCGSTLAAIAQQPTPADLVDTPLGKISITAIAPQETCDAGIFLPGNVTDGITGPSNDPIFAVRSPAYIVSFTRRKAAP